MLDGLNKKTVKLLRWSEQYTKTDMVYLAKGSFWTWLGKGAAIITGTAMAVAFANLLPKEVYGNYKYILSVAAILGAFTLNGMGGAITRSVARGFEGSLKAGLKETAKYSGAILVAGLAVSGYYFWQGNALLGGGMLLVAILQPIIQTASLYQAHLFGKKLFKVQGIYLLIWELLQATLIICALFFTKNALILVAILLTLNALFVSLYLWQTLQRYVKNQKTEVGMLNYGKHLSVMTVVGTGARHLDKVLIFQTLGAVPTAIYSFALLPTEKLDNFFRSVSQIILPKFSDKSLETLQKTLWRKALIVFGAGVILATLLILALPTIFQLLFPTYLDSVIYAQWLALSLLFIPELFFSQALLAHVQKKFLYIINISSNLLKIILLFTLLPLYGIWGAVYSLLAYLLYRTVIKIIFFYRSESLTDFGSTQ
jgi:O-antigen/teichoic acid export membrane protein